MTSKVKDKMTYANVASTAALVIAIAGGGVAAASNLVPRNSVGSPQIINGAVKSSDIKNGSIGRKDLSARPLGVVRAYAWNDRISSTGVLDNGYVYNESGGAVTSAHTGTGSYTLNFDGLDIGDGNVQVSAYGSDAATCQLASWDSAYAHVRCYDAAGAPVNSRFSIAMIE